jgi:hypothetical protein
LLELEKILEDREGAELIMIVGDVDDEMVLMVVELFHSLQFGKV